MNRSARLFVACVGLLVLGSSATAQDVASPEFANAVTQARQSAWKAITSGQGSGASVAIMQHGKLVYSEGIGVADRARNRPVDPHTRFNVGSVAKMFAAASILLLVEEGKVDLDAPITRYIPEFTMADPRYRAITVRMLLNHSAGLPAVTIFVGFGLDNTTHAALLEVLARSALQHAPGAMSRYSNDGFTLAEMVVERASGRKYMDFLAKRIFAPLGMRHTGPSLGELGRRGVDVAEFYDAKHGKKYPREIVPVYAAGGISSTAEDLCRFGDALMPGGTPLLSAASLAELLRPQPTSLGSTLRHTAEFSQFGWDYSLRVGPTDSLLVFAKGGNTPFYTSELQIVPEQGIVVAFIISGRSSGDKLTQPILAGMLEDLNFAVASGAERPPQGQPIPSDLDRYVGSYAMETGAVSLSIDASRRKLLLTVLPGQGPPGELIYEGGYFYGPGSDTRFYFLSYDGKDLLVASTMGLVVNDAVMFQKLEPAEPPLAVEVPMNDETWLIRNAPPWMEMFESAKPMATSHLYEELPGYVSLEGVRRVVRSDFASIAATALREQNDLMLFAVEGKVWMRTANVIRSRARDVAQLARDTTTVTIGPGGYNEWRAVARGAVLRFRIPDRGRVVITAADTVVHDSLVDGNEAYAPAGSYVFFAGVRGDTLRITEATP